MIISLTHEVDGRQFPMGTEMVQRIDDGPKYPYPFPSMVVWPSG